MSNIELLRALPSTSEIEYKLRCAGATILEGSDIAKTLARYEKARTALAHLAGLRLVRRNLARLRLAGLRRTHLVLRLVITHPAQPMRASPCAGPGCCGLVRKAENQPGA